MREEDTQNLSHLAQKQTKLWIFSDIHYFIVRKLEKTDIVLLRLNLLSDNKKDLTRQSIKN